MTTRCRCLVMYGALLALVCGCGRSGPYELNVQFTEGAEIQVQTPVDLAGEEVGRVVRVRAYPKYVLVQTVILRQAAISKIRRGITAQLHRTARGDRISIITSGVTPDAPLLASGSTIIGDVGIQKVIREYAQWLNHLVVSLACGSGVLLIWLFKFFRNWGVLALSVVVSVAAALAVYQFAVPSVTEVDRALDRSGGPAPTYAPGVAPPAGGDQNSVVIRRPDPEVVAYVVVWIPMFIVAYVVFHLLEQRRTAKRRRH